MLWLHSQEQDMLQQHSLSLFLYYDPQAIQFQLMDLNKILVLIYEEDHVSRFHSIKKNKIKIKIK